MYAQRKGRGGFDPIADYINAIRKERGDSINRLAEETGRHREQLTLWFSGKRPLRCDYLVPILDYYGLEILPSTLKRHVVALGRGERPAGAKSPVKPKRAAPPK